MSLQKKKHKIARNFSFRDHTLKNKENQQNLIDMVLETVIMYGKKITTTFLYLVTFVVDTSVSDESIFSNNFKNKSAINLGCGVMVYIQVYI